MKTAITRRTERKRLELVGQRQLELAAKAAGITVRTVPAVF